MPEQRLQPLHALGGKTPAVETIGTLTLRENADCALASMETRRGQNAAMAEAARRLIGETLPEAGKFVTGSAVGAFWTGPDLWMLESSSHTDESLVGEARALMGGSASITEQSDAWARFDIEGEDALRLFERLCSLDIYAMPPGSAARTPVEHVGCFILRRGESAFSVYSPRSYADSIHHALTIAALSIA